MMSVQNLTSFVYLAGEFCLNLPKTQRLFLLYVNDTNVYLFITVKTMAMTK